MTEPTPQSVSLPFRITFNTPGEPFSGQQYPPHVLIMFPSEQRYMELTLHQCRELSNGLVRFLASVDAKAVGK